MPTREEAIKSFDPNGPGIAGNLFGLPFDTDNAQTIIIPAPWEVTVSYHTGTAKGAKAILDASVQVDLFVNDIADAWTHGISMLPIPYDMLEESNRLRMQASQHIARIEKGEVVDADDPLLARINEGCENFNIYIKSTTQKLLKEGKFVGMVGGDHSTPLGFLRALSEHYNRFGILHIDAHADLRKSYEGFTYSHASIMYNALKLPAISRIVQVGIRDLCEEEKRMIERAGPRVVTFYDEQLKAETFAGKTWDAQCNEIVKHLPPMVYISFDIDGLDPKLCPGTGTPVPGGFELQQIVYLFKKLEAAGKKIIGFDVSEVAPGTTDWDANVGARALYALCNWMAVSQGKLGKA